MNKKYSPHKYYKLRVNNFIISSLISILPLYMLTTFFVFAFANKHTSNPVRILVYLYSANANLKFVL